MIREEERAYLTEIVETIEATTGRRPRGLAGSGADGDLRQPSLLAELGLDYTLDWTNDDQPYALEVPGMYSVPYSIEMNDVTLLVSKSYTEPEFLLAVKDQLDQLYEDAADFGA